MPFGLSPDIVFTAAIMGAGALIAAVWRMGSLIGEIRGQLATMRAEREGLMRQIAREEIELALQQTRGSRE